MATISVHNDMSGPGPLTVAATWKVKPGKESEFEEWHRGISASATAFPGHLGVSVMRPGNSSGEYVVIFKFDTYEHLASWQESEVRRKWLQKAIQFKSEETRYQTGYGIEFWFTSPREPVPPPRWKMAVVTMLAIYPVVNLMNIVLKPVIGGLSPWVGGLIATPVTILLMTYMVMPGMTRLLSRWLFAATKEDKL
ncbi:MAG: antibiotic biosynthesis monooxygenase [Desulfuromonadales bacterium]